MTEPTAALGLRAVGDTDPTPVTRAVYRRSEHIPAFAVDHRADGTITVVPATDVDGALAIPDDGGIPLTTWLTDSTVEAVLYREPELNAAKKAGHDGWVFLVGTEASADLLRTEGAVATTCAGGLAAWRAEYAPRLRDLDVVVVVGEGTGSEVIGRVTQTLGGIAKSVRVLTMPTSAEAWFSSGKTVADLDRLVMAAETASTTSWPDPTPLRESPVPSFPVHVLPEWVEGYVNAVSHDVQAPVDFAAAWMLGALATAAGGLVEVQLPTGHLQGANLFVAVLAEPGTRKSAVHTAMTLPLVELEERLTEMTADRRREARADHIIAEKELRDAEASLKAATFDEEKTKAKIDYASALETYENTIVPPKPELSVGDATPEAVSVNLWRQGGRYAIASAEANVFQQMSGLYGKDPNIDIYLQGYTNDPMQIRRGGHSTRDEQGDDGRAEVLRPALTINVGGQPAVLHSLGRDGMLSKRGGLDRFIWIMPDDPVGSRETWPTKSSGHHRDVYHQSVVDLGVRLWEAIDERRPNGEPARRPTLVFEGAAAARMKRWLEDKEARLRPAGDLRSIRGWAAKIDSFVARIAALLHLAQSPSRPLARTAIDEDTVAAALAIGDYLIAHAKRAMRADGDATQIDHARTIVDWIRRTGKAEFDRREAYTSINRFRKDADAIDAPLTFLVRRGWLREVEIEGSRVNRGFVVNPLVHHGSGDA